MKQRGCREVVRYEYFVAIIPVFFDFFKLIQKKRKKLYKPYNFSIRLLKYWDSDNQVQKASGDLEFDCITWSGGF